MKSQYYCITNCLWIWNTKPSPWFYAKNLVMTKRLNLVTRNDQKINKQVGLPMAVAIHDISRNSEIDNKQHKLWLNVNLDQGFYFCNWSPTCPVLTMLQLKICTRTPAERPMPQFLTTRQSRENSSRSRFYIFSKLWMGKSFSRASKCQKLA